MNNFAKKRARQAQRFETIAQNCRKKAEIRFNEARVIGDIIPFGQPILVGHHSEAGHRRSLTRIHNNMRKGVELERNAEYYERKARNAKDDSRIFSDDPEAITKLKDKISSLRRSHNRMKEVNAHYRKYGHFVGLNLSPEEEQAVHSNINSDFGDKKPFASYSLQNSLSDIARNERRLKELVKAQSEQTSERVINGVRLVDNVEENRLQLIFPAKPDEETRAMLKYSGFRWSPRFEAWQRHRSNQATWKAERILKDFSGC